jgi:UDP-N-acetylmuramate dehydrogenase
MKIENLYEVIAAECRGKVRRDAPLADYVAYGIGGPADVLLEPEGEADVRRAIELAQQSRAPLTVLGNGTNLLVRDGGIRGLVLFMGQRRAHESLDDGIETLEAHGGTVLLRAPARCAKARLLDFALTHAYAGLEFSAGIPGSLGGAVFMNAGTKWGSYGDVIEKVRFFNPTQGFFEKSGPELGFRYRGHGEGLLDGRTVVLSVELRLRQGTVAEIRAKVDEILTYRGGKQPLELRNCGSVFKNPAGSELGAGRLIEACGLKGHTVGGAQVSTKHANFILNLGQARAADVELLIAEIQRIVQERKGIALETEVIILGTP